MSHNQDQELMQASSIGDPIEAKKAIANGANSSYADPNNNGWTVLMEAATKNHPEIVEILVGSGASLEQKTGCGCTVLTKTSCEGTPEMLKTLLSSGANASHINNKGLSLLDKAISCGNSLVVEFLTDQMPFMDLLSTFFSKNVSGVSEIDIDLN